MERRASRMQRGARTWLLPKLRPTGFSSAAVDSRRWRRKFEAFHAPSEAPLLLGRKGRVKAIFLDRFRGKTDANFGSPAVVTDVPLRIRQPVCRQPDVCRRNGNVTRKWIWSHQTPVRA